MKTVVIREKSIVDHYVRIADDTPDEALDRLSEEIERCDHPGDIASYFEKCGVEVIEPLDSEGCWERSEFEYNDDFEE